MFVTLYKITNIEQLNSKNLKSIFGNDTNNEHYKFHSVIIKFPNNCEFDELIFQVTNWNIKIG